MKVPVKAKKKAATASRSKAGELTLKLKVMLAADQKAVDPVVQSVMNVVRPMHCANGKDHAVELALAEALANAVIHGAKLDFTKVIECDVLVEKKCGIVIVVRDPGEGFDKAKIPSPVLGQNLFSSHGRGIYLINQLMDEVQFLKNGAEIRMVKR